MELFQGFSARETHTEGQTHRTLRQMMATVPRIRKGKHISFSFSRRDFKSRGDLEFQAVLEIRGQHG